MMKANEMRKIAEKKQKEERIKNQVRLNRFLDKIGKQMRYEAESFGATVFSVEVPEDLRVAEVMEGLRKHGYKTFIPQSGNTIIVYC